MKSVRSFAAVTATALVVIAGIWSMAGAQNAPNRPPLPFPSNYDFPATNLQALIDKRDVAGLRRHGWYLWAGLNQPGYNRWPIWRSWHIPTQLFPSPPGAAEQPRRTSRASLVLNNAPTDGNAPINLAIPVYLIPQAVRDKHKEALKNITESAMIPDGENFQNNGDLMLVAEPYSQPSFEFLQSNQLYLQSKLQALLSGGSKVIPPGPNTTIVLKHMYWPVKRHGLTALPVADMSRYDKPAVPDTTYVGFENMERWPNAVAIDPERRLRPKRRADVTYLHDVAHPYSGQGPLQPWGPNKYRNVRVVPISNFYYKQISKQEYDSFSTYDRVLLDASFYWVHKRLFEPGDYLVAVASHIVTREIGQWTLQTVWWYDRPNDTIYSADRPDIPGAIGPWRHYLLNIEYGLTTHPGTNELPITYNPYIELASHPVVTNCRNCHIRAAWPNGQYMQTPGPDALANIGPDDPTLFSGKLRTDFLWTIPDRAR